MPTISVVIPTKNECQLLRPTLAALAFADEIIVVDEFSTDGTVDLVNATPKARLLQRTGLLNENINAGIDAGSGDWILIVDSDEVVTPELARELRGIVETAPPDVVGYSLPSRVYWCGLQLRYGPQYDPKARRPGERYRKRFFRRGGARYACETLHEDLTTSGRWEEAENVYDHYTVASMHRWFEKRNFYSERDARLADLRSRSNAKAAFLMFWMPIRTFLVFYLKRRGYKDGALGVAACGAYAVSVFMDESKKWERIATAPDAVARGRDVAAARAHVAPDVSSVS
ncbi:MAG: glycosyltransferase family 2 protein [Vulcanimicrobiaceae bacterium]